jgi:hypothetical protein
MTKDDRLRARIANLNMKIGGQRIILTKLGERGRRTQLASELLVRLIEIRDAYCDALPWSERPGDKP